MSGHPLWFQVQVNSLADEHSSGELAHIPPVLLKHHPQPCAGVHVSQVVYAEH